MKNKSFLNRYKGTIISIIVHLIFLFLLFRSFKNEVFLSLDSFRPTSTIGYQVELVHTDDTAIEQTPAVSKPDVIPDNTLQTKPAEVKLKQSLAKPNKSTQEQPKKSTPSQKAQIVETKKVKELKERQTKKMNTANRNQDGVTMTDKNQVNIVASAPKSMNSNQVGDGGSVNSSTNGTGSQNGKFDFRVIQYGRDAADAIKQNIVVPPNLANQYFTYRAFIRLNPNMQYESMVLVKSTGNLDMDRSIARALRQTIYPPLPPGADFEQYKNIDFTIK